MTDLPEGYAEHKGSKLLVPKGQELKHVRISGDAMKKLLRCQEALEGEHIVLVLVCADCELPINPYDFKCGCKIRIPEGQHAPQLISDTK